jgi:hypothetical protein
MIDDHHGRAAGRATLLVKAVDGILGTHSSKRCVHTEQFTMAHGRRPRVRRLDSVTDVRAAFRGLRVKLHSPEEPHAHRQSRTSPEAWAAGDAQFGQVPEAM